MQFHLKVWRKKSKETKITCLVAILFALCEGVCYPKPIYKEMHHFTPNQISHPTTLTLPRQKHPVLSLFTITLKLGLIENNATCISFGNGLTFAENR